MFQEIHQLCFHIFSHKAAVEVTGEKLNRGTGYGLEIPCIYHLYGPDATLNDLRRLSKTLETEHLTDTLCIIVLVCIM